MATRLERGIDWGTRLPETQVEYAFAAKGTEADSPFGKVVSSGFDAYEQEQFRKAFKLYASFTDLRFKEVKNLAAADLRLASFSDEESSLGAMGPPGYPRSSGSGAFNRDGTGWDDQSPGTGGLEQGGYGFITVIHEIGHGLGLAHPHDRGGSSTTFPGVYSSTDLGAYELNQGVYTVMSYNDGWKTNPAGLPPGLAYGFEGTPMAIDIAVLQEKYGTNERYQSGDNVYRLPDVNQVGTFYACIWDAGGRDTIVNPGVLPSTIDLRTATLKPEPGGGGYLSSADGIFGGFTIAKRVKIEAAVGGAADDVIVGNAAKNRLDGGAGDDALQGGRKNDQLFGGDGDDRLAGGDGSDRLDAGAGHDVLDGGAGDDWLVAGPGSAVLFGGSGRDTFVIAVLPESGALFTVGDFAPGFDVLRLSAFAFAGLGATGPLAETAFGIGEAASEPADRIVYDPVSGLVRYDGDGSGPEEAVAFVQLGAGLGLAHSDIVVG